MSLLGISPDEKGQRTFIDYEPVTGKALRDGLRQEVHTHVCMYICMYVCKYVCMYLSHLPLLGIDDTHIELYVCTYCICSYAKFVVTYIV